MDDGGHHFRGRHGDDEGCIVRSLSTLFTVAAVSCAVGLFDITVIAHAIAIAIAIEDGGRADPKAPSDAGGLHLHGEMAALVLAVFDSSIEVHHLGIASSTVHIGNCHFLPPVAIAIVDSTADALHNTLTRSALCVPRLLQTFKLPSTLIIIVPQKLRCDNQRNDAQRNNKYEFVALVMKTVRSCSSVNEWRDIVCPSQVPATVLK